MFLHVLLFTAEGSFTGDVAYNIQKYILKKWNNMITLKYLVFLRNPNLSHVLQMHCCLRNF